MRRSFRKAGVSVLLLTAFLAAGTALAQLPPAAPSRYIVFPPPPPSPASPPVVFTPRWETVLAGGRVIGMAATRDRIALLREDGDLTAVALADGAVTWR